MSFYKTIAPNYFKGGFYRGKKEKSVLISPPEVTFPDSILAMNGDGGLVDYSPNQYDVTNKNISLTSDQEKSFIFLPNSNFRLTIDSAFMNSEWSISFRFKLNPINQYHQIFTILQAGKRYNLTITNSGALGVYNTSSLVFSLGTFSPNAWHNLKFGKAYVNIDNQLTPKYFYYKDEILLGTHLENNDFLGFVGNADLILGTNSDVPSQSFNGFFDDINISTLPIHTQPVS